MLIICSETPSRAGMARAATLAGRVALAAAAAEVAWLASLWAGVWTVNSLSALLLQLMVQTVLVALLVLATAVWSLARNMAANAGNGMPELEFREGALRLLPWPGADGAISCAWSGVRKVSVTAAGAEDARWRQRRLLSQADVRHMLVVRVLLERDAIVRAPDSVVLQLLWWAWAPWRVPRQLAGTLELEVLLCPSQARAAAVMASLGPLAERMDLRERFGAPGHVWQIEADADGAAVLVMAGGKHRERADTLLDRPERPPGMWGTA